MVVLIVLLIGAVAFVIASRRATAQRQPGIVVHSLPGYHGWLAAILAIIPAIALLIAWSLIADLLIQNNIAAGLGAGIDPNLAMGLVRSAARALDVLGLSGDAVPRTYADLAALANQQGLSLPSSGEDYMVPLADMANQQAQLSRLISTSVVIVVSLLGAAYGISRVAAAVARPQSGRAGDALGPHRRLDHRHPHHYWHRALDAERNHPLLLRDQPDELLFRHRMGPAIFGRPAPSEVGQFGLIPLLSGTLYIAFVSMLVAVPVGLMAAVYMGEYASPRVRSTVKPLLELLAGIPTIVYGIFAVVTLGPFLRDLSAALTGGSPFIQAQSVFTAGLIMGVMLIPVVSSLSDDVITAVPRAMRDGSLALGATRSETIKRVILPAALPGIVGALLLTASRAIGETMIVVLAAGVAARLTINPFEAMTTITVKIVNQLTGDLEFDSPQTLVAFALGLTLFVVTLGMNIYALYIVRKYREQYE